jgi:hypothetical protein
VATPLAGGVDEGADAVGGAVPVVACLAVLGRRLGPRR